MSIKTLLAKIKHFLMDENPNAGASAPEGTAPVAGDQSAAPAPENEQPNPDTATPPAVGVEVEVEFRLSEQDGQHFFKKYENGGLVFTSEMFPTAEQAEAAMVEARDAGKPVA